MSKLRLPYQNRVIAEKAELDIKLYDLGKFINENPKFEELDPDEQSRMEAQAEAMEAYSDLLEERIDNF